MLPSITCAAKVLSTFFRLLFSFALFVCPSLWFHPATSVLALSPFFSFSFLLLLPVQFSSPFPLSSSLCTLLLFLLYRLHLLPSLQPSLPLARLLTFPCGPHSHFYCLTFPIFVFSIFHCLPFLHSFLLFVPLLAFPYSLRSCFYYLTIFSFLFPSLLHSHVLFSVLPLNFNGCPTFLCSILFFPLPPLAVSFLPYLHLHSLYFSSSVS